MPSRIGLDALKISTGLYWETPNGPVILFYTGRHHAGEIVDQLLRHRLLSSPKLVKCTDGASKDFDHEHADKLVESTCNAHALLKFRDIKDKYPVEYAEAGSVYQQVFDNDDDAKALGLSPGDRMLYHRDHSKPLLQQLKKVCEEKIISKRVEPSSAWHTRCQATRWPSSLWRSTRTTRWPSPRARGMPSGCGNNTERSRASPRKRT